MGFGRNPYVTKAQVAEQRAADAPDDASRVRAYRDAAHQWDRAAERERPGKMRAEYEGNAIRNRDLADGNPTDADPLGGGAPDDDDTPAPIDPMRLN